MLDPLEFPQRAGLYVGKVAGFHNLMLAFEDHFPAGTWLL
jgi:hypothetical protein